MSDPLVQSAKESRLNALNKKIIEIKKKIQLSEGQRKACFEECDARKKENADKVSELKKEVKELQITFAKAKNNQDAAESEALKGQEPLSCVKRRTLEEAIVGLDEDIIRLRKKLDLVRYESDKQQKKLSGLLEEYEEYMSGTVQKLSEKKLENPVKKKIIKLENQLQRIHVMQMEADTVRKKYRGVRSSLKSDAALFASSSKAMEDNIREQKLEMKRLQDVKEEAIHLRDITKGTLIKQEAEAVNTTKQRDSVILDYRQKVEDRKLELERLERMIFPSGRPVLRQDFNTNEEKDSTPTKESTLHLEEAFAKLREATGVSRTEDVLNRFLSQKATKDKLQKMRVTTESEKMNLERKRQQLMAEIEMQKFSETKDAEQNAEELEKLNRQIAEQIERREISLAENKRVEELLTSIDTTLWQFYDKLRDICTTSTAVDTVEGTEVQDVFKLLEIVGEKVESAIARSVIVADTNVEDMEEPVAEKFDTSSPTPSGGGKIKDTEERPFFPIFPLAPAPTATQALPSEDEEEVPTRSILKRQAQLLVDTKSRRKGFNFRR